MVRLCPCQRPRTRERRLPFVAKPNPFFTVPRDGVEVQILLLPSIPARRTTATMRQTLLLTFGLGVGVAGFVPVAPLSARASTAVVGSSSTSCERLCFVCFLSPPRQLPSLFLPVGVWRPVGRPCLCLCECVVAVGIETARENLAPAVGWHEIGGWYAHGFVALLCIYMRGSFLEISCGSIYDRRGEPNGRRWRYRTTSLGGKSP